MIELILTILVIVIFLLGASFEHLETKRQIWCAIQKLPKIQLTTDDKEMGEFLNAVDLDDLEAITNITKMD